MTAPTILVFDSGLGGLTVFREIVKARPDANYIYLADDERFPYGHLPENELIPRVLDVIGKAVATHKPELAVIACNTASTLTLAELRTAFTLPFVGTVPAIKPACANSKTKMVSVLGTEATVAREYTKGLIQQFAQGCSVNLVGAARLAGFAEAELNGQPASDDDIRAEIAPCFVINEGKRTDTVALACTHYPLLSQRLSSLGPWPVEWVDPAPAIARRVAELIGKAAPGKGTAQLIYTSGKAPSPSLAKALPAFGF